MTIDFGWFLPTMGDSATIGPPRVRLGVGTALVGSGEQVAARLKEYAAEGIDTFILSGYPHLEEAQLRAVAISGSPRAPSKSKALAELMLRGFERAGCATQLIDVATLPAEALLARASSPELDAAIAAVGGAQVVVAASPTYRALYTGALKAFFDLMPQAHLADKICVPVLTAASLAHLLAIEHGFGPLFASLNGVTAPGVYATDDEFVEGAPSEKLAARVAHAVASALALARARTP